MMNTRGGGQKNQKSEIELACKLIPFYYVPWLQKVKVQPSRWPGSASSRIDFFTKAFTKEKLTNYLFSNFSSIIVSKISFDVISLLCSSIRFFWYPYCYSSWHIMSRDIGHQMSSNVIWWQMTRDIMGHKL